MIAGIGILLWTCLFWGLTHLVWKSVESCAKVYLLIAFNALFLIGVFVIFPCLEKESVASVQKGLGMLSAHFR